MSFKIVLGQAASYRHPEANLYIDNWMWESDRKLFGLHGEVLHDPDDAALAARLDSIPVCDVEIITTLQGRYSLGILGKVHERLRDRHSLTIRIETVPDHIRASAHAPYVVYGGEMDAAPPRKTDPLHVFLCHCCTDKPKVRELYRFLVEIGASVWFDEESLVPGQDWRMEIEQAVRTSDLVVVCLSASAVDRVGYVQKEIQIALDVADEQPEGLIFIIPTRLEECDVPARLARWQWVDLFAPNGADNLAKALRAREAGPRRGDAADSRPTVGRPTRNI